MQRYATIARQDLGAVPSVSTKNTTALRPDIECLKQMLAFGKWNRKFEISNCSVLDGYETGSTGGEKFVEYQIDDRAVKTINGNDNVPFDVRLAA